mmetsp:Transcript_16864/g.48151  ORF Transcript_16864/g.48151 Transcript_16864/m.48151 type:complete len:89 (-) Transcript_16864:92-358(-)
MAAATAEAPRVGTEVRLHVGDRAFRGRVFCWDPQSDAAVLEEPHPQSTLKQDLRIVRLSLVDRVEVSGGLGSGQLASSGVAVTLHDAP